MSFSTDTKAELSALPIKKKCCKRAYAAGLLFDADTDGESRALGFYQNLYTAQVAQKAIASVFGSNAVKHLNYIILLYALIQIRQIHYHHMKYL